VVAKKNVQTTFTIPKNFTAAQRKLVAELIIKKIQDNTANGLNRWGGSFPSYSAEYKQSLDFKNGGKSSLVNLELTGDMMVSLEIINSSKTGEVTIGYKTGSEMAGQVEGNQIGSYGGEPNSNKARPFLGLPQAQLDLIIATVAIDTPEDKEVRQKVDGLVSSLLSRFGQ
jgi:hypothetical protein